MTNKERFPNAFQFFASYFHQDFTDDFGEPEAAIESFIAGTDPMTRAKTLQEIQAIVGANSEDDLEQVVFGLGCYYSPSRHRGWTMSHWLKKVVEQLGVA